MLADQVHLLVSQTTTDAQPTNKAVIAFLSPDPKITPFKPYDIALPDGRATYGIAWERGAGVLWILQKDLVRKCDFTNPAQVKETRIEPGSIADVPEHLRAAMRKAFDVLGAAGQQQNSPQPKGKDAQSLFKVWQDGARTNGNIPGGALGSLARVAANFVKFNPTDERAPKIAELIKRIDMSHDWTPAKAVALLDEATAIYAPLPSWAVDEPIFSLGGAVQTGQPFRRSTDA